MNDFEATWTVLHSLLHAVKDQAIPDTCMFTLIGCFSVLISNEHPVWKYALKEPDGALWMEKAYDLALTWATAPRTAADIQKLKCLKCRCKFAAPLFRASENDRDALVDRLHAEGVASHEETTKAFELPKMYSPIITLVDAVLEPAAMLLDRSLVPHRLRLRKIPKRSAWPTSIKHLLPRGPEDTIQGLLAWCPLTDLFHSKFNLLNAILSLIRTCQAYVIPHLITSRIFLEHGLLHGIDVLHTAVRSGTAPKISYALKVAFVSILSELLGSFLVPALDIAQRRLFLRGSEGRVLQALSRLVSTCGRLGSHDADLASASQRNQIILALVTAEYFAALVLSECDNAREYLSTLDPVFVQDIEKSRRNVFPDPKIASWRRFVCAMYRMDEADRCYSPHCTSGWTRAHVTLRVCRGCLRLTYCSRRCQARAWSYPTCAHRDVCADIRQLCEQWKIDRRPVFMQVAIIDVEKTIVPNEHEYLLVKKINEYFSRLASIEIQSWSALKSN